MRHGVDGVIDNMRRLGIHTKFPRHISMALGTPDLTLLEVAAAEAVFANNGREVVPKFVERVVTADGDVVLDNSRPGKGRQLIPPQYAYLVADMMKAVVERGTGRRALILRRPAAGKTGTSTGHRDAWFIGYTRDLLTGVWVGRDDFTPIGARATGGSAALPIWVQFMRAAHPETEPRDFETPEDVVFARANEMTGMPAPPGRSARWIPFARGTVPQRFADAARTIRFERSTPLTASPEDATPKVPAPAQ
jgi:penicillin-binding protein 1A